MAFCSGMGSLIKKSLSSTGMSREPLPVTSMLNAIRCMSTKLFIGGLSYGTDDQSLREAFSSFGDVTEARVINDRDTGRSRGFGFVNFAADESASSALSGMDGQELNGRTIRVSYANERPSGGSRSGYGGGAGGYGGGYGGGAGASDFGGGDSGRGY
ncbi:glycine-rich RNA-binding protein 2, mitochondrial-like protein [Cinnamomum micranthum f. kanehirae]|uniref:Glycine-rich RNA-binding protein 2, mitochondrial-like protein n=1 Tax=Cinnamomum micranthum f. kanehirae TaxID=337451 RepID=A0A443N7Y4_9MAGN|nr:glycine-rich RNA-binding protein 2, mitochondrial-like protein [Cinnamomum micranthum f. kanehirae]